MRNKENICQFCGRQRTITTLSLTAWLSKMYQELSHLLIVSGFQFPSAIEQDLDVLDTTFQENSPSKISQVVSAEKKYDRFYNVKLKFHDLRFFLIVLVVSASTNKATLEHYNKIKHLPFFFGHHFRFIYKFPQNRHVFTVVLKILRV